MEYANSVWDPDLKTDIQVNEHLQTFGLKPLPYGWHSGYVDLLNFSGVPSKLSESNYITLSPICHYQWLFTFPG